MNGDEGDCWIDSVDRRRERSWASQSQWSLFRSRYCTDAEGRLQLAHLGRFAALQFSSVQFRPEVRTGHCRLDEEQQLLSYRALSTHVTPLLLGVTPPCNQISAQQLREYRPKQTAHDMTCS